MKERMFLTFSRLNMFIAATTVLFLFHSAEAYEALAPLPGVPTGAGITPTSYLAGIFNLGIGLAGVLAVLMIVIGGIQYIGSGLSPSARKDAKEKILSAILGLLLALGSWLILNTVNPTILGNSSSSTNQNTTGSSGSPASSIPTTGSGYNGGYTYPGPSGGSSSYIPYTPPTQGTSPTYTSPGTGTSGGVTYVQDILTDMFGPAPEQVPVVTTPYDPQSDFSIQLWCAEQGNTTGQCAKADLNGDGSFTAEDSIALNAFRYDVNNDGKLNSTETPSVQYCFFRQEQDPQNPGSGIPHPPMIPIPETYPASLYAAYQLPPSLKSSGWNSSLSPCANGAAIRPSYFDLDWMRQQLLQSGGARLNLDYFYQNFYQVTCDMEMGTCTWGVAFDGGIKGIIFGLNATRLTLASIMYSTFHRFDLNDDLIADLRSGGADRALLETCIGKPKPTTGLCARADFDNNGVLDARDHDVPQYFINNLLGQAVLIPPDWSLKDYEMMERKPDSSYPDLATINYCSGSRLISSCAYADVNLSCSPQASSCTAQQIASETCNAPAGTDPNCRIDAGDRTSYLNAVSQYDINGDGVVNLR